MTEKVFNYWGIAEFEVFYLFFKFIILQKHHNVIGNPFVQALHSRGTLENGKKYKALSLQLIDTNW